MMEILDIPQLSSRNSIEDFFSLTIRTGPDLALDVPGQRGESRPLPKDEIVAVADVVVGRVAVTVEASGKKIFNGDLSGK